MKKRFPNLGNWTPEREGLRQSSHFRGSVRPNSETTGKETAISRLEHLFRTNASRTFIRKKH